MSRRLRINNFWICKMHSYGVTFRELSQKFDIPYSTLRSYVSGVILPTGPVINKFCMFFNVDLARATAAFEELFIEWGKAHRKTHERQGFSYKPIDRTKPAKKSSEISITKTGKTPNASYCIQQLYGKLSYEDFMRVMNMSTSYEELLRFAYDKVDYATFMTIWN